MFCCVLLNFSFADILCRLRPRSLTVSLALIPALPGQVVEQGLTPDMAMRACNNPAIRGDALSRAIAKIVAQHAKAEYVQRRGKRRAGRAAEASPSTGGGGGTGGEAGGERQRTPAALGIATEVTLSETPSRPDASSSSAVIVRLSAPYLKGGPTHFQRKVEAKVDLLFTRASSSPAQPERKTAVVL